MESFFPIRSLPDQIYENLSAAILSGELKQGEKLIENELCKKFGTSRSPIRESFRRLESEGLIIISPRKGTFVKKLCRTDIEEAFAVRGALEGLAAQLALPHLTVDDLRKMAELIRQMDLAIQRKEPLTFREANLALHHMFINASKNKILHQTLKTLEKGVWLRISSVYYQSTSGFPLSNKMHKAIFAAFKGKDQTRIRKLVETHIEDAKRRLLKFYDRSEEG
jgi:DNA-binding GntR family transcriptional regulator